MDSVRVVNECRDNFMLLLLIRLLSVSFHQVFVNTLVRCLVKLLGIVSGDRHRGGRIERVNEAKRSNIDVVFSPVLSLLLLPWIFYFLKKLRDAIKEQWRFS